MRTARLAAIPAAAWLVKEVGLTKTSLANCSNLRCQVAAQMGLALTEAAGAGEESIRQVARTRVAATAQMVAEVAGLEA